MASVFPTRTLGTQTKPGGWTLERLSREWAAKCNRLPLQGFSVDISQSTERLFVPFSVVLWKDLQLLQHSCRKKVAVYVPGRRWGGPLGSAF